MHTKTNLALCSFPLRFGDKIREMSSLQQLESASASLLPKEKSMANPFHLVLAVGNLHFR